MYPRIALLAIICLALSGAVSGQNHFFRKYDSRQGLPSSEVYYSVQDDDGYMWFSTDHGLVRYDGYQFLTFDVDQGLPENPVFTLYKDAKNRVWFVTLSGKLGYHENGRIHQYKYNDRLVDFLKFNVRDKYTIYNNIVVDSLNNIWLSLRSEGLFRIDSLGNINKLNPRQNDRMMMLVPAPDGSVMIDFAKVNPTQVVVLQTPDGKSYTFDVSGIITSRNHGHYHSGVEKVGDDIYLSEDNTVILFRSGKIAKTIKLSHPVVRMNSDRQGRIWMSTNGGGGRLFDRDLNELDVFLDGEPLSSFCEDHEGGLWFTSMNSGLFYIPEKRNRVIVPPSMFRQEKINSLKTDEQGRLWFSSINAFGYFDGKQSKNFKLSYTGDTSISAILPVKSGKILWIGTNRGLLKFDVERDKLIPVEELSKEYYARWGVKSLFYDSIHRYLWVGSYAGIFGFGDQGGFSRIIGEKVLNRVEAFAYGHDGNLYIGNQYGLYIYDGKTLTPFRSFGMGPWRVTALKWRNDSLWIGTRERGLFLLTSDTLLSFGTKQGLLSASVSSIELMGGYVVAATNKGISVLARKASGDGFNIVQNITAGYGLLANEVPAMTVAKNKIIASSAGFISFLEIQPDRLSKIRMPCHITNVVSDNKAIEDFHSRPIELRHSQNNISLSYFAISFFIQGRHTYRHRLTGLESDWVVNQQTTAAYPYLPPGSYVFEVQVLNPDGSWSPAVESVKVNVLRPFWLKWWFVALVVVLALSLLGGLFYALMRYFLRQRNVVNEMRRYQQEALALQMNPHFLFNALNTVQRYILENDKVSSSRYLARFAGFMRSVLDNAQKPDTTVAEEIQLLRQYLELESARTSPKFTYQISCSEQIDQDITLIPVFLIQPLVENAIQHGLKTLDKEGLIKIVFSSEAYNLMVVVEDNGIGRKAAQEQRVDKKYSLGLSIIEKRITLINKSRQTNISLELIDLYTPTGQAAGTMAVLRFPGFAKLKNHG